MPEGALFLHRQARSNFLSRQFEVGPGSNNKKEEKGPLCFVRNREMDAFEETSVDTVTYPPPRMLP